MSAVGMIKSCIISELYSFNHQAEPLKKQNWIDRCQKSGTFLSDNDVNRISATATKLRSKYLYLRCRSSVLSAFSLPFDDILNLGVSKGFSAKNYSRFERAFSILSSPLVITSRDVA